MGLEIGWTEEDWSGIQSAAREAYERTARVRSRLPDGGPAASPYVVVVPRIDAAEPKPSDGSECEYVQDGPESPIRAGTNETRFPLHIACDLGVSAQQLADLDLIRRLVRSAASRVGGVESGVVMVGNRSPRSQQLDDLLKKSKVRIRGAEADGALDSAKCTASVTDDREGRDAVVDDLVVEGITKLQEAGSFGPYHLFLPPKLFRSLNSRGRRSWEPIRRMLGNDLPPVLLPFEPLAPNTKHTRGLLIDESSHPIDIVDTEPFQIAVSGYVDGGVVLRAEVRMVLRVIDPAGACALELASPPPKGS